VMALTGAEGWVRQYSGEISATRFPLHPAGDRDIAAGDVRRVRRDQPRHGCGDLVGLVLHHGFMVEEARGMVLPAWAWMSPICGRP
jgi:hypothetical protein